MKDTNTKMSIFEKNLSMFNIFIELTTTDSTIKKNISIITGYFI